jgi:hypothetical protein
MNPKQILKDLETELQGKLLEEVFEVNGAQFKIKLLNDYEMCWVTGFIKDFDESDAVALATSSRSAIVAISVKEINEMPIIDMYNEDWEALPSSDRRKLVAKNGSEEIAKQVFSASLFKKFVDQQTPEFVGKLFSCWNELSSRQTQAQEEIKNS